MSQAATASSNLTALSQIPQLVKSLLRSFKKNREMNNTYRELNRLSDSELRDIGIHRSNIRAIAMEQFYDNRGDAQ